ncbi:MAG: hypothetical protein Q9165_004367 [Trypethelium subeluteriae]
MATTSLNPSASPSEKASSIIQLLTDHGSSDYIGEPITQLAHSLQCAQLASTHTHDPDTILAALLHDIGQFLPTPDVYALTDEIRHMSANDADGASDIGSVGRVGHETIGAQYLAHMGFSSKVSALVESHVAAKRYLCAVDPGYWGTLSEASKRSLEFQGGPMDGEELAEWTGGEWVEEMCRLRKWDDRAKVVGLEVEALEAYSGMMEEHLEHQQVGKVE